MNLSRKTYQAKGCVKLNIYSRKDRLDLKTVRVCSFARTVNSRDKEFQIFTKHGPTVRGGRKTRVMQATRINGK